MAAISLTDMRRGTFDPHRLVVPTYLEFDQQIRAAWHDSHPRSAPPESYRALNEIDLRRQWISYVIGRYERGAHIPDRVWRMLTADQRDTLLETSMRAQLGGITAHSDTPNRAPRLPLTDRGDPRRVSRPARKAS